MVQEAAVKYDAYNRKDFDYSYTNTNKYNRLLSTLKTKDVFKEKTLKTKDVFKEKKDCFVGINLLEKPTD